MTAGENGLTCAGRRISKGQNYLHSRFAFWTKLLAFGANGDDSQQLLQSIIRVSHVETLAETRYGWSVDAQNNN